MSNPYDAYDLPEYSPASGARLREYSGGGTTAPNSNMPQNNNSQRPQIRRRFSKNMLEEEEIRVVKKRLGVTTPKDILAKKYPKETMKRIDYVLVHSNKSLEETHDSKKRTELSRVLDQRLKFEAAMFAEGLQVQEDVIGELTYIKIHTPFWRLAKEAENIRLEMPLLKVSHSIKYYLS